MMAIHIVAAAMNGLALAGLTVLCGVGAYFEFGEDRDLEDQSGKIALALFLAVWLIVLYIFFCQLTLARYLKRNSVQLFNSMIDSIGRGENDPSWLLKNNGMAISDI